VCYRFDGGVNLSPPGARQRQFDLGRWVRRHYESQVTKHVAHELMTRLAGARISIKPNLAPPASMLDAVDLDILRVLNKPLRLDEVWRRARCPQFRLVALVYFLEQVGALSVDGIAARTVVPPRQALPDPSSILRANAAADPQSLRPTYRKLVRALHPDLQPGIDEGTRRDLERRLADLNQTYRELAVR
jgi:hypothetical protein